MQATDVVDALGALAQETRLEVYRLLVRAGPSGLAAGRIASELGVPAATLSFHLKELVRAGLLHGQRRGRCLSPDSSALEFSYPASPFHIAIRSPAAFLTTFVS